MDSVHPALERVPSTFLGRLVKRNALHGDDEVSMDFARRAALACFLLLAARGCGSSGSNVSRARGVLELSPATLDFGNVPTGDERLGTLSLRNEGTGPIVFGGLAIDGDSRTAFTVASALETLNPGESTSLEVRYRAPEKEGPDGATLVIQSDADKTPQALVSLAGRSVTVCEPPLIRCAGACVNPAEDPGHCGACGTACESKRCAGGKCQPATCTDKVKNGAETGADCGGPACPRCANGGGCASSSDCQSKSCTGGKCLAPTCGDGVQNGDEIGVDCGGGCLACALGTPCSGAGPGCAKPANAVGECKHGKCAFTCLPGFADCDRDPKNGCEADLFRDVLNCGACGTACTGANAILECAGGVCAVDRCSAGFGDCDKKASTGCETPLTTLSDCGACGVPCALRHASSSCGSGTCELLACDAGFGNCDKDPANGCEAELATDAKHCGQCARACAAAHAIPACVARSCAIGKCDKGFGDCNQAPGDGCETSLATLGDCGGCGLPCTFANATASCPDGACELGACAPDYFDCDGNLATGCEINLAADPANCGGCRKKCALPNAVAGCAAKSCTVASCVAGLGDCDQKPSNGCETDLATHAKHCGQCGRVCAAAHATPTCAAKACAIGQCDPGFGDCNRAPEDGCETPLTTLTDCGGCGSGCGFAHATASCPTGSCQFGACTGDFVDCDRNLATGCEVDPTNDPANCGACGRRCSVANGVASCASKSCTVSSCAAGFEDCDKDPSNGCETELATDPKHCGQCGRACAAAHATPACVAKACAVGQCDKGFGDCNKLPGDGCETPLTTLTDCGGCGTPCAIPNATSTCPAGTCQFVACRTDFFDCDGKLSNGCETDLGNDPASCGACGRTCAIANGVAGCASRACTVSSCAAGFKDCDKDPSTGCETPATTLTDCGGCGVVCSVAQGTATCATGACAVKACQAPYVDCDGDPRNGCETKTDTDAANCGRCGNVCSILNGTGTCIAGGCAVAGCASGFADCDKDPKNGCEKPLNAVTDCGACGVPCAVPGGTGTCKTGACAVDLCSTSRADCDKKVPNGCEVDLQLDSQNCGSCGKACKSNEDCVGGKCLCKVSCTPYSFRNCKETCVPDGNGCHAWWWTTSCPLYEGSCRTIYGHSFKVYCNRDPADFNCVRPELTCRPYNYCSAQGDGIPRCY